MINGVVQFYLDERKYGYIRVPETREEFHFLGKDLHGRVKKGDHVAFRLSESRHGFRATDIHKAR